MATQLLGGTLADRYGGKLVMAGGIVWFSLASMLLPAALSGPIAAAGLTVPAILAARCAVGLGEGVALPSMNNLVGWFVGLAPPSVRLAGGHRAARACGGGGRRGVCAGRCPLPAARHTGASPRGPTRAVGIPPQVASHLPKDAKARGLGLAFTGFHCGEAPAAPPA
jgi:hypothetical protein